MSPRQVTRYALAVVIALVSAGCGSNKGIASSGGIASMRADRPETIDVGGALLREAQPAQSPSADPIAYLAYAYGMQLELPGDRLIGMMDQHVAACRDAGLRVCQLVASRRDGDPSSLLRGSLALRGEPAWLQRFMTSVQNDAVGATGRVTSQWTSTDDLTRQIVDTEATLRAKRALRDRLQQLLATRPGSLSDLLGVERELSRVQGEIDSTESNLVTARTRVVTSALTLEYVSSARGIAGGTFEPLRLALGEFVVAIVDSTATLVTVVGALIPWATVLTLAVWFLIRRRRRRRST